MSSSTEREKSRFYEDATNRIGTNHGRIEIDEDGTTSIEENDFHGDGHVIHIVHVPTNSTVHFKAFLTDWNDTFTQEWDSTTVIGRMDPIMIYKRTTRDVTISFNVVAEGAESGIGNAKDNFTQLTNFIKCLYPKYSNDSARPSAGSPPSEAPAAGAAVTSAAATSSSSNVIKQSPLFKVSFMN